MKRASGIIIRYLLMIAVAIPELFIFYWVFTPLTAYPSYFLLNLFFDVSFLTGTLFLFGDFAIELVPACIAGAAYYLLFVLNLSIPKIKLNKRIKMVLFAFAILLLLNILRIFLLSIMAVNGSTWFDFTHKTFWYALSTVFVVGIWLLEVKLFKIKEIPFYTDLNHLFKQARNKK